MSGTGAAPAAIPDQVLRHLTSVRALREGGHRTVLRLEPDHLGEVTVTVDVRSGAVRMAVSGGAEALAAVREGLGHLRTSLADSGLNLGDVSLRSDASGTSAAPAASTGPGADGRAPGSGPRPDAGAGSRGRPAPAGPPAQLERCAEAPLLDAGGGRVSGSATPEPEPAAGAGDRPGRLDVRVSHRRNRDPGTAGPHHSSHPTGGSMTSVGSTTGTSPNPTTGSTSAVATSSTSMDQDTFLKLLVAQLKYQDPSNPADATQFLSETAQFTVVQKLEALSTLDQQVLDTTRSQSAAGLIGKQVTYTDYSGTARTGTVTGTTLGSKPTLTVDGTQVSFDSVTAVGTVTSTTTG